MCIRDSDERPDDGGDPQTEHIGHHLAPERVPTDPDLVRSLRPGPGGPKYSGGPAGASARTMGTTAGSNACPLCSLIAMSTRLPSCAPSDNGWFASPSSLMSAMGPTPRAQSHVTHLAATPTIVFRAVGMRRVSATAFRAPDTATGAPSGGQQVDGDWCHT